MKKQRFFWLATGVLLAAGLIGALAGCNGDDSDSSDGLGSGGQTATAYKITVTRPSNGILAVSRTTARAGEPITISTMPNNGFRRDKVTLDDGTEVPGNTFDMPARDVTISATFVGLGDGTIDDLIFFNYQAWLQQIETWKKELQPILDSMTPREKYGQMTQAEYDYILPRLDNAGTFLPGNDVSTWFLGSVLSGGHSGPRSDGSGSYATSAEWAQYTNALIVDSMKTRLRIPVIYGQDDVHGASKMLGAIMLPHSVGLGAAVVGNTQEGKWASFHAGMITGEEMVAGGIKWTFGPVLGVAQDIRWGRTYESFGEQTWVADIAGPANIRGIYEGQAAPSSKHFGPEGQTINGANGGNAIISYDDYRPIAIPYLSAIEHGVMCVMASYGSRNGMRIHEDKELLTTMLKEDFKFPGMIITDWSSLASVTGSNYEERLGRGINAGIDMVMAAGANEWKDTIVGLEALVNKGVVPQSRIDDAVMRILLFKKAIPNFWNKYAAPGVTNEEISPLTVPKPLHNEANREKAIEVITKTLVLLKNADQTIQKLKDAQKILLVGQGADDTGLPSGGWSLSWQGQAGKIMEGITLYDALKDMGKDVTYSVTGSDWVSAPTQGFDAVIAFISETPYAEGSGDRTGNIEERAADAAVLANALTIAKTNGNVKVTLVIFSGRPLHLRDRADNSDVGAIVAAWWPGTESGAGLAKVLFGDTDFIAGTPYTWTKTLGGPVLYPFGYGLKKDGSKVRPDLTP